MKDSNITTDWCQKVKNCWSFLLLFLKQTQEIHKEALWGLIIFSKEERAMTVLKIPVKRDPVIFASFSSTSFCEIYFSLAIFSCWWQDCRRTSKNTWDRLRPRPKLSFHWPKQVKWQSPTSMSQAHGETIKMWMQRKWTNWANYSISIIHNSIVFNYKTHVKSHQNLWEWDLESSFMIFYLQTILMQKTVKNAVPCELANQYASLWHPPLLFSSLACHFQSLSPTTAYRPTFLCTQL